MASSNYPYDQDTAFNSFVITNASIVQSSLGKTYSQSELVPINFKKVNDELGGGVLAPFPILSYPSNANNVLIFQDEISNFVQQESFASAYNLISSIWKDLISNTIMHPNKVDVVQVVVTPLNNSSTLVDPASGRITIVQNYQLVWFVPQNSFYA